MIMHAYILPRESGIPADLGLGVNSALLDVSTLEDCLQAHASSVADGLRAFERVRVPENHALIRLNAVRYLRSSET